jgi:glutamate racemase
MNGAGLGVLDWGIGGLGFVTELWARAPGTPVVYLSDSGATPYGRLPRSALTARVQQAVNTLVARGAGHVIIACNAASSVAHALRARVPITSIVAAAAASVPGDLRGTLWVLGGGRTVRSGIYQRSLARPGRRVHGRIAQPLSAHVEAGEGHSAACAAELARVLTPVRDGDALLLACTHYPALAPQIRGLRPHSALFDPAARLAEQVLPTLDTVRRGPSTFATTGDPAAMARSAEAAWGLGLAGVEQVTLAD